MKYYIDTSVIVKWYKENEPFEGNALELLDDIVEFEVIGVTSSLTSLELIRALQKIIVPSEIIREALSSLDELFDAGLVKASVSDDCINLSKKFVLELKLYASDAIHIASSVLENADCLLTADEEHMLRTDVVKTVSKNHNVEILHIRQYKQKR